MTYAPKRNILIEARKRRNLTQQEVSDFIGIHITHYSNIENGKRTPGLKVALKISDFFDIDIKSI